MAADQFFHFLISPFSKGRYRGICFNFSSLPSLWERGKERGGDCNQVASCILSPSPTSLSKEEGESTWNPRLNFNNRIQEYSPKMSWFYSKIVWHQLCFLRYNIHSKQTGIKTMRTASHGLKPAEDFINITM